MSFVHQLLANKGPLGIYSGQRSQPGAAFHVDRLERRDLLPVCVVEPAEPDAVQQLVAAAARVPVAVVSEDETGGTTGDDGETTDAAL